MTELIHFNIPPPESDDYATLVEDISLKVVELLIANTNIEPLPE